MTPTPQIEVAVYVHGRHVQTLRVDAAALAAAAAGRAADPQADAPSEHWHADQWLELTPDGLPFRLELNIAPCSGVTHTTYRVMSDGSTEPVREEPPDRPLMTG